MCNAQLISRGDLRIALLNVMKYILKILFLIFFIISPVFAQHLPYVLNQTPEDVVITIYSKSEITYKSQKTGNILTLTVDSKDIVPSKSVFEQIDKGLINHLKISFEQEKAQLRIDSISIPKWTYDIKKGEAIIFKISYSQTDERASVKTRAIKTKNTYKAGESILKDLSVILDASERQTAVSDKIVPFTKTPIADLKLGLKDNLSLITSQKGKPQPLKIGDKAKFLDTGFLPFEKSESINLIFNNKDIAEILKILTEKTDKNLIVSPSVKGKRSIEFKDMSPEEAMAKLLDTTDFEIRIQKDTILVGSKSVIDSILSQGSAVFPEKNEKRVFVLKKIRGEKVMKTLDISYPEAKYTFYPKLNAFEIISDNDTLDEISEFFTEVDLEVK